MTAEDALLKIQDALDGVEWDSETTSDIAEIMIEAGYKIHDLDGRVLVYTPREEKPEEVSISSLTPMSEDDLEEISRLVGGNPNVVILDSLGSAVEYANQQIQKDHERIWLEPMIIDGTYGPEGRTWSHDNPWPEDQGDMPATEYVRADIYEDQLEHGLRWLAEKNKLKALLQSIINDVRSMGAKDREGSVVSVENWLVGFSEWTTNPDDDTMAIEWPNLAISVSEAEAYLKELEG